VTKEQWTEIEAAGIEVVSLNRLRHGFDWRIVKDLMRSSDKGISR
jgi:hypothetical protein